MFVSLGLALALSACAELDRTDGTSQYPDDSFVVPDGGEPRYAHEQGPYPFGMNNPASPHNARFLLNVMGWLSDVAAEVTEP